MLLFCYLLAACSGYEQIDRDNSVSHTTQCDDISSRPALLTSERCSTILFFKTRYYVCEIVKFKFYSQGEKFQTSEPGKELCDEEYAKRHIGKQSHEICHANITRWAQWFVSRFPEDQSCGEILSVW